MIWFRARGLVMMRTWTIVLLIGLGLAAGAASAQGLEAAEIVVVPLDLGADLLYLDSGNPVSLSFDAGRSLEDATAVSLHVVGSGRYSRLACWQDGNIGAGVNVAREDAGFAASLRVDAADLGSASLVLPEGDEPAVETTAIDATLELTAAPGVDLAAGTGTVVLTGLACSSPSFIPPNILCVCDPSAILSEASLVVTFGTGVPVEDATWSALKADYR